MKRISDGIKDLMSNKPDKTSNVIYTLEVKPKPGKPIKWETWGIGVGAAGLGAQQSTQQGE